jgi:hypothetical protein
MPDTSINDAELISNAIKKAKILQRDSFITVECKECCALFSKQGESFSILKTWNDIEINNRAEVKPKESSLEIITSYHTFRLKQLF